MPSGVVTPGLGFMYNGCMGVFDPRPGRAGSVAPGKARFTAMCPTILFDGDRALVRHRRAGRHLHHHGRAAGHPERRRLRHERAARRWRAPRFCTTSDTIDVTNRILRRTERALREMGYPVRRAAFSYGFAGVHALRRTAAGWDGGADPGRDGMALSV